MDRAIKGNVCHTAGTKNRWAVISLLLFLSGPEVLLLRWLSLSSMPCCSRSFYFGCLWQLWSEKVSHFWSRVHFKNLTTLPRCCEYLADIIIAKWKAILATSVHSADAKVWHIQTRNWMHFGWALHPQTRRSLSATLPRINLSQIFIAFFSSSYFVHFLWRMDGGEEENTYTVKTGLILCMRAFS